jgi:N-acetylglucosamine kinase-like BadF-type ATPase
MSQVFLGVDGGANKTQAIVINAAGEILGIGLSRGSNHQSVGIDTAIERIEQACRQALGTHQANFACFCLAGADLEPDFALLQPRLERLQLAQQIDLRNDTWAALRAGSNVPWGAVVICGSGFNAAVRTRDGREFILPSLGWMSGDFGGGGDIARNAISQIARAWDGRGSATSLSQKIIDYFGYNQYEDFLHALYIGDIPSERIYEVAPLVFEAACEGDAVAQELVIRTGSEAGHTAGSLLRRMGIHHEVNTVVAGGSVFNGQGPFLFDAANAALHRIAPKSSFARMRVVPAVGAVLLACDLHGLSLQLDSLYQDLPAALKINPTDG